MCIFCYAWTFKFYEIGRCAGIYMLGIAVHICPGYWVQVAITLETFFFVCSIN